MIGLLIRSQCLNGLTMMVYSLSIHDLIENTFFKIWIFAMHGKSIIIGINKSIANDHNGQHNVMVI